jgi:hypothetical protein
VVDLISPAQETQKKELRMHGVVIQTSDRCSKSCMVGVGEDWVVIPVVMLRIRTANATKADANSSHLAEPHTFPPSRTIRPKIGGDRNLKPP